jgi:membrane-associated phospholipid phosphatase
VELVTELFQSLLGWDSAASSFAESLRWQPLTVVFLLASAWWVKWPLIAAVGAVGDAARRALLPRATLAAVAAVASAGVTVTVLKHLFHRARPPVADHAIHAIGVLPSSASLPSGHAATAFAAAVAVGLVYPRLRRPLLALAAVVALSRVYLGVHYLSDVLAGAALGTLLGVAATWAVRAVAPAPRGPAPSLVPPGTSSAPRRTAPG